MDPGKNDASLREVYSKKALAQIPRLLSQMDRNPFSPTYGCLYRIFWHDRAIDFPSAFAQFSTHALALVYSHPFTDNPFYRNRRIRDWTIAGLDYCLKIQHHDGSFDEFYPNERGWAGPTAFLMVALISTYELLRDEIPESSLQKLRKSALRSARFLSQYEEEGILANHHALAVLALYKIYQFLKEEWILQAVQRKIERLKSFASREGWFLEYDGADLGYLSATVSFLGKLFKAGYQDSELLELTRKAIEFCSYFLYPDNSFGGNIGSRQTVHFYPHGFEILAPKIPLAGAILDRVLSGIEQQKILTPELQEDRYFICRLPEFLEACLDFAPRPKPPPSLPYQEKDFNRYFDEAGIQVFKTGNFYGVCNYKKGGVLKIFSISGEKLLYQNSGMTGVMSNGAMISTQWINPKTKITVHDPNKISVRGRFHQISNPYLTPLKMILFRIVLLAVGWNLKSAAWLKGQIRRKSSLGTKELTIEFQRTVWFSGTELKIDDQIELFGSQAPERMKTGGELLLRYVPQSRYFMPHDLKDDGSELTSQELTQLKTQGKLVLSKRIQLRQATVEERFL